MDSYSELMILIKDMQLIFLNVSYPVDTIHMLVSYASEYKWLHRRASFEHWLYFEVLGSNARLLLSNKYRDSSNTYSIIIGTDQNTRCAIYKGSSEVASATTPNILHSRELRSFWVSW